MTKQRKIISEVIRSSTEHLTAEQIFLKAKKQMPSIAVGTVYRNLSLMVDDGEIMKIEILNAPDCYDKNAIMHHHIICDKCHHIEDISLEDLTPIIEKESGIKIISYDLNIHYVCQCCSKSN